MNEIITVVLRLSLFLVLLTNLFGAALPVTLAAPPASPNEIIPQVPNTKAQASAAIRTVILYSEDAAGAQTIADLLELNDFTADIFKIFKPVSHAIFLHVVMRASQGTQAALTVGPNTYEAIPDFSVYDLIVVTPETGFGSNWSVGATLYTAIEASGLPVAGLGSGGYTLFGKLNLDIGHPHGSYLNGNSVKVGDFGASQAIYLEPTAIPIPGNERLLLYNNYQSAVTIPLNNHLPDGIRVAKMAGTTTYYPIIVSNDQFLLWGFNGLPDEMTVLVKDLFVNALYSLVSGMELPIKGAEFIPDAGYDPDFLIELGAGAVPLHAFVQLYHIPSPAERSALSSSGVTLQNYLGGTGTFYTALIDPSFNPNDATVQELIRWLGGTQPELKVDPELTGVSQQSATAPEITTIMVTFFDDVTAGEAATVLKKYTAEATYHNHPIWQVILGQRFYRTHRYQVLACRHILDSLAAVLSSRILRETPTAPM